MNTLSFESMQRVAQRLAASSLCPVSLRGDSHVATVANCFLVTTLFLRAKEERIAAERAKLARAGAPGMTVVKTLKAR